MKPIAVVSCHVCFKLIRWHGCWIADQHIYCTADRPAGAIQMEEKRDFQRPNPDAHLGHVGVE